MYPNATRSAKKLLAFKVLLLALIGPNGASGADSDALAREQMREASEYAAKKNTAGLAALRLESRGATVAARLELDRYPYEPGQRWRVKAELPVLLQTSKSPARESRKATRLYEFNVLDVTGDVATVEVRTEGEPRAVKLRLDGRRRVLGTEGAASVAGLAQFPLAVPSFNDHGARETAEGAIEYTGEDSLSRPMRVIWKKGEPWPRLMSGAAGTATLEAQ